MPTVYGHGQLPIGPKSLAELAIKIAFREFEGRTMSFLAGTFTAQTADGKAIRYTDGKRYLWLMSLTGPMIPMLSVLWYFASGQNALTLIFPLA